MNTSEQNAQPRLTQIGKYEVLKELGAGGMGVVYRCIDRRIGREVAVKTLNADYANKPEMLARFYEEGRHTGRLNHPNIVIVYDVGDENGMPYIVMELVEGQPLDKLIPTCQQIPLANRLRIAAEICTALGYAHSHNVIHRDVKPGNIFVLPSGRAKLLDFGIARPEVREEGKTLTRTGFLIGTIAYMAPERLRAQPADGRADIFAMGIVLYELLTGRLPFDGEQAVIMQKLLFEQHVPLTQLDPTLPPVLEQIVSHALAKSPDDRYARAEEMAADLEAVIADLSEGRTPTLVESSPRPFTPRSSGISEPVDALLTATGSLVQKGQWDQALSRLQSQPAAIRDTVRIQQAIAAIEDLKLQPVFRTIGRAYASLGDRLPEGRRLMHNAQQASDQAGLGTSWTTGFEQRALDASLTQKRR